MDTLIKHADISMYRAKELGQNKLIYYTAEMNAESRRQLALETSLRRALERDEMTLVYQPKIDTSRKTIIGAEALLRWDHPEVIEIVQRLIEAPTGHFIRNRGLKHLLCHHCTNPVRIRYNFAFRQ